jgi:hypothetical protein
MAKDFLLSKFEWDAIDLLLRGADPVLEALRVQMQSTRIESRFISRAGEDLYFEIEKTNDRVDTIPGVKHSFHIGDVEAVLEEKQKVGIILWVKDGYLKCLEISTYGREEWPNTIDSFTFRYIGGERDLALLKKNWLT